MRVIISGHEICGLIHDLAGELSQRGHDVVTIAKAHQFYPYSYDYPQYDFLASVLASGTGGRRLWGFGLERLWEINRDWHRALEKRLRIRMTDSCDLYVRVWGNIPF